MINKEEYRQLIKKFLTQANDENLDRIADDAMNMLTTMSLNDYLKDPLVCYNEGPRGKHPHNNMNVGRFSTLLPLAGNKYKEIYQEIENYKKQQTNTDEEEKQRKNNLKITKWEHLFAYYLLPYSDGQYYHWNIDIDNVYDRFDDHPLIPNISAELLRQEPCVVYAERSATCGLFALVAADPKRMDIDNRILPMPTCCMGIEKDACQDNITQLRYLCGRDEQWQPHDVIYCDNYIGAAVKQKTIKPI